MDLIYTDSNKVDQGVLLAYEFDLAFGDAENDFECRIQADSHCCGKGSLLYVEGTEYGGIVDSLESDTAKKEVAYRGRTWHGVLNSKVIEPDSGAAYLTISGEANAAVAALLTRLDLTDLFSTSTEDSEIAISDYKMDRYITGYDGIKKMLKSVGAKLLFSFDGSKVVLSVEKQHDYSTDDEFSSDSIPIQVMKKYNTVNHLVCLGSGELENRMVVHLYADANGDISETQTFTGVDEYTAVYDYSNIESLDELITKGTSKLKSLFAPGELSIDFNATDDSYDVGDIVGAYDRVTDETVTAEISKKIVTIKNGQTTISYKVGE